MDSKEKAKNRRLLATYGISLEEFNQKLKAQGGVCFICKRLYPRMNVDHVHVKGFKKMKPEEKRKYVRGILCFGCNTGIKCVEKTTDGKYNMSRVLGMLEYFTKYPIKGMI